MKNAGLEEAQAGIKTAGKNINNLRSNLRDSNSVGGQGRVSARGWMPSSQCSSIHVPIIRLQDPLLLENAECASQKPGTLPGTSVLISEHSPPVKEALSLACFMPKETEPQKLTLFPTALAVDQGLDQELD